MNIQKIIHTLMISLLGIIPLQADVSESDAEINDNIERYQPAYHLNPESLAKMIEYKVAGFRYVYEIRLKNDVKVEPKPYWYWLPPLFLGYTEDDTELELVERKYQRVEEGGFLRRVKEAFRDEDEGVELSSAYEEVATEVIATYHLADILGGSVVFERMLEGQVYNSEVKVTITVVEDEQDIIIDESGWVKNSYSPAKVYMIDYSVEKM